MQVSTTADQAFDKTGRADIYRSLFASALDALVIADGEGRPLDANPAATALLGYSRDELLRLRVADIVAQDSRWTAGEYERSRQAGYWRGKLELRRKDGTLVPVDAVVTEIVVPTSTVYLATLRDLSERRGMDIERQRLGDKIRDTRFRTLIQHAGDLVSVLTADGTIRSVDPEVETLLGYRADELIGRPSDLLIHPDDRARSEAHFLAVVEVSGPHPPIEIRIQHQNGSWRWMEMRFSNLLSDPDLAGVAVNCRDVTERKQTEDALRRSEAGLAEAQRLAHVGSWEWCIPSNHVTWSDELCRIVGIIPEAFSASYEGFLDRVHPDDRSRVEGIIGQALITHEGFNYECRLIRVDGTVCTVVSRGIVLLDAEGHLSGIRGTVQDISERKRFEEGLRHQAFHDVLTGLPNRACFIDRLGDALARANRSELPVVVLFLDLDRFKVVNDSLGHVPGDQVLIAVGSRLSALLRDGDMLARFGGDEFAVLLEELTADEAVTVAQRLLAAFHAPFPLDGREIFISASIGIALSSPDLAAPAHLLQAADVAMYQAKADGPADYAVFDPSMNARAVERLELETDLQGAVERRELVLHYQPKIDLRSGSLMGVEVLVRWHHPRHGRLMPGDFLPLAEESGLIVPIGRWVLAEACRQAAAWHTASPSQVEWTIAINLSAREFRQPRLIEHIARVLAETGLPPAALELEITEQVAVDGDQALSTLWQLKHMGVQLALDDFGTGFSSLSSLRRLPVDTLKVDRSFVQELSREARTRAVVQAVTALAHELGMTVVAEGVETEVELATVRQLGIDIVQGAYFANALPQEACSPLLAGWAMVSICAE